MHGRFEQPSGARGKPSPQGMQDAEHRGKLSSSVPSAEPLEQRDSGRSLERKVPVPWETRLGQLLDFKKRQGHCNVPRGWPENPSLSYWVINQRYQLRRGTLSQDRIRSLQESGISWVSAAERKASRAQAWTRMYVKLMTFKIARGGVDVGRTSQHRKLARWLANQRYLMRCGTLPEDRRYKLEALGILWNVERGRSQARDEAWACMYSEARKFIDRHRREGAAGARAMPPKLLRWIAYQRQRLDRNLLPVDRRRQLLELGLESPPSRAADQRWHRMYAALAEYKRAHGHCAIPWHCPENLRLRRWVARQRDLERQGKLVQARKESLERIGLVWSDAGHQLSSRARRWERMLRDLVSYKTRHGHTRIPRHSQDHPELADWVARQRHSRKVGRLSPDRIARLTKIGFDWKGR